MELLILDKSFNEVGRLDQFSSLQWNPIYYQSGKYELHCSKEHFGMLDEGMYLYRPHYEKSNGRKGGNIALMSELKYSKKIDGSMECVLKGKFVEEIMNNRIIPTERNYSGTREQIVKQIVKEFFIDKDPLPYLRLDETIQFADVDEVISVKYKGDKIGDVIYSLLKEIEMSYLLEFDYLSNTFTFKIWQGLDRTDIQNMNEFAIFSDDFETIKEFEYTRDSSKYCNYAYVVGVDDISVEIDQRAENEERCELYVYSSLSKKNDNGSTMTDEQYKEKLIQIGKENLDKKRIIESFDGDADNSNIVYKEDYDLGDLCTSKIKEIKKMADKRITEIKEVYEDGEITITPKFGNDYLPVNLAIRQ